MSRPDACRAAAATGLVLWAGVALEDFPTISVTQEEVGDQASSGRGVLVGTLVG